MARILLGWELGAGRGHVVSLVSIAGALAANGHEVAIALQRFEPLPQKLPRGITLLQAPVWPGLLNRDGGATQGPNATIFDILARLGLNRQRNLTRLIQAWDGILATFHPDIAIGDYAPALMLAARGRAATIATGPGFQIPPSTGDTMPRIGGGEPSFDESELLDRIDADLREAGREPLATLPDFFRVDRQVIASFAELDPYCRADTGQFVAPGLGDWCGPDPSSGGSEIFVYVNGPMQTLDRLWHGIALSGFRARVHMPVNDSALIATIERHGVKVEREPVPWAAIARRSRIAINHGAHGTMCALLLTGIPQIALPADLEKILHARALAEAGLLTAYDPRQISPEELAEAIRSLHADDKARERARANAPGFAARMAIPFETAIAATVESLLSPR